MKIAYLSRGHNVYDRRFLEKMIERGHKPTLISYFPSEKVQVSGVPVLHYDSTSILRFSRLTSLQIAWHLRKVLKQLAPDVLHTGWVGDCGFYGALSGFHPTLSMPWGSDILLEAEYLFIGRQKTRFALRGADMITCDCELVKNRIIQLSGCGADKVVIFPWGIDLGIFKPLNNISLLRKQLGWEQKQILIMTRKFEPIYNIETFIEALSIIIRKRSEVRVILVGSGSLELKYRAMLEELGLIDYVCFAGQVDETGMVEYLNAADVYVTASLSDGTSCSLLEAMACALPVVVSDAPAYLEWVKDGLNGYIVPKKDPRFLAERIIELLENKHLRHTMGRRNLQIAQERADWDKNFDKLEAIYTELVSHVRLRNIKG